MPEGRQGVRGGQDGHERFGQHGPESRLRALSGGSLNKPTSTVRSLRAASCGAVVISAEQCPRNIEAPLGQAECSFGDVVRVRYPLPDREDFEPCRPVLRRAFGGVRPAATMLVCGFADPRMKIEIEVHARRAPVRSPA
ncbi:Rid family hydrolase [Streptomyces hydrogenans]|uniref:Rid family hydrolase n=1 Tax=Streptomyces hydrogenans TaxID=1873719 RepID=UPI00364C3F68